MRAAAHRAARLAVASAALGCAPLGVLLLTTAPRPLAAQGADPQGTGRITGTVAGDAGLPLPAAQISIVGTQLGATTNDEGRFTIAGVAPGVYQLRAQRIGYAPSTVQVTVAPGQTATATFRLQQTATTLSTQVVVGYTTQQRRDVSDAVAGVTAEQIQDQQVATVEEALRGRIPGVQIAASGEPGRPAQVIIRGQNFLGNPTPLYVVDGMYLRQNPNLNPNDIETIEVLKDASAAAQYGSQAANGVVVIRTRRGRPADHNRIEARTYYGYQDVGNRLDLMNAREWAAIERMAYEAANEPVPSGVTAALAGQGPNTDWQNAVFRRGAIQDHNVALSGGTANASYLINAGVLDQQGAIITTDFRRYSFRVNSDIRRGRISVGENIALSRALRQGLSGFPLIDVAAMIPSVPVRDPNNPGGWGYGSGANPTFAVNPVGQLEGRPRNDRSNQVIGSAFGELQLLGNLRYRLNLGLNYEGFGRSEFSSIAQLRYGPPNEWAELREIRNNFTSVLAENLLTFDDQFAEGNHRISAVAGFTEQRDDADDVTGYRRGFSDETLRTLSAGGEADQTAVGTRRTTVLQSYLLRANYTLLDRYLFTGSVRRDGSSRFGANNRWGNFAAASVGWVVSDEPIFRSVPFLGRASFLKLRGSTGTLGNQDIGDYAFDVPVDQNRLSYPFGGTIRPGATEIRLANPDIRWQENRQDNAGLDLGLFEDRLNFTMDFYRSTSSGLLVRQPLPPSLGIGDPFHGFVRERFPFVNAGQMRNTGTEFGLTYRYGRGETGAFRLNTTATLTTTRNRVLSLGQGGLPIPDNTGIARTDVGYPLGTFWLIRSAGIFQSQAEVDAHTTVVNGSPQRIQPTARPGDMRFIDANRDGQINDLDRVPVGNGSPRFSGGLFFDGGWRSLDFGLNLRGAGGYKIFNVVRFNLERLEGPSNHPRGFAPWTEQNRSTTTPRASRGGTQNNLILTDRWIEDGGFLRVQNIVLGYQIPAGIANRLGGGGRSTQSRVYINLQNVHTFTDYTGYDPEVLGFGNPLGRGIDDGFIYPNVRTVTFGIDLRL